MRDILVARHVDVDVPWRELPKRTRDWILFTDEQPTVPVYAGLTPAETRRAQQRREPPSYTGTFSSARRNLFHTFKTTQSPMMKRRVMQYMTASECAACHGKRLKPEALRVTFAGLDIMAMSRLPLKQIAALLRPFATGAAAPRASATDHPEQAIVAQRIAEDAVARLAIERELGYLALDRSTPTLSPGELQRLRLATQVRSNLFGVVYVLDEPSAGLHPADTEALLGALDQLKAQGNSLFVVEHELDVIRRADWIVDVGPAAGQHGGEILYSGPPAGLAGVPASQTRPFVFGERARPRREPRAPTGMLELAGVTRNNLDRVDVAFPLGVMTAVTGVSGSGKSSLVSQALVELVAAGLGAVGLGAAAAHADADADADLLEREDAIATSGRIVAGSRRSRGSCA